jgi:hypothetical protein
MVTPEARAEATAGCLARSGRADSPGDDADAGSRCFAISQGDPYTPTALVKRGRAANGFGSVLGQARPGTSERVTRFVHADRTKPWVAGRLYSTDTPCTRFGTGRPRRRGIPSDAHQATTDPL